MQQYVERRKRYNAIQLKGIESLDEIMKAVRPASIGYDDYEGVLTLRFRNEMELKVNLTDYIVWGGDSRLRNPEDFEVMSCGDFGVAFEPVYATGGVLPKDFLQPIAKVPGMMPCDAIGKPHQPVQPYATIDEQFTLQRDPQFANVTLNITTPGRLTDLTKEQIAEAGEKLMRAAGRNV